MTTHECTTWQDDTTFLLQMAAYGIARRRLVCLHGASRYVELPELGTSERRIPRRTCAECGGALPAGASPTRRLHVPCARARRRAEVR